MPKIKVNNIELDYADYGSGKVLVLLHGLGSTKQDWAEQIPFFSKDYRVLAVDLRGHGKSTIPKDYGVELMCNDIREFLDKLNITKATLIGFSMGGAVAFEFAVEHQDYLENLVIVNSGPDFNAMGKIGEDLLNNRTDYLKTKGLTALANEIALNMFPEPHQEQLRVEFETRCRNNDYEAYYNAFTTLMKWGLGPKLETIKTRTLVVASDMDYTPVSFKEAYVSRLENSSLAILKDSRHGGIMDQPRAFNNIVYNFLSNES